MNIFKSEMFSSRKNLKILITYKDSSDSNLQRFIWIHNKMPYFDQLVIKLIWICNKDSWYVRGTWTFQYIWKYAFAPTWIETEFLIHLLLISTN